MNTTIPTLRLFHDTRRPKKDQTYPVKLTVYYKGEKLRFKTKISLTKEDWKKINGERLKDLRLKGIKKKVEKIISKAETIVENIEDFSFDEFARQYYSTATIGGKKNDLIAVYNQIVKECREDERPGSATSYESSMKALLKFDPNISFGSLSPRFLRDFQDYFLKKGNSLTSVGIYLRQLRAVYNRAIADKIISKEEYPFTQYNIPGGYNKKKALTNNEINKVLNYEPSNSLEERALDFWKLSYLCNGINIGDLLKLKKQNIDNEFIIFKRSKTLRTKKEPKIISIALLPETKALIEKHKNGKYRNSQDYIFPVLKPGLSDEEQKRLIANFNRSNNQHLDKICKRLEIAGKLSNMTARHSFATVLKRKDANPLLISDLLGHSSLKTTESYLGSFMNEQLLNTSKMLLELED